MGYNTAFIGEGETTAVLLDVAEARNRLLSALTLSEPERVPLTKASGRVLAQEVNSAIDLPPFSNSSMDGFAIRAADVARASGDRPITLRVVGDIPAGQQPKEVLNSGEAMRIMTGAPLPRGADSVIPVEDTDFNVRQAGVDAPDWVQVFRDVQNGAYIRPRGEDLEEGACVLEAGRRLRPQDLGMLATLGVENLNVYRHPRVALLSTGDELLPIEAPLQPGKIRESNSYSLAAQVESCGGIAVRLGIVPDVAKKIKAALDAALEREVDLVVSSAGVSVGAFDYVRTVVEDHGQLDFWRVNMRPGKPLAFGHYRGVPFVGLPGNPVSAFVGFEVFLRPALLHLSGETNWQRTVLRARLFEGVESDGRESYLRGVVREEDGVRIARLTGHQGSGNLFSLVQANALVILPAGVKSLPAGADVLTWPL
jgi:molybdopterin molybdotransferase